MFLVECKNVGAIEYGLGREFLGLCYEVPSALNCQIGGTGNWEWRGDTKLGAFVATLSQLPQEPSAFELISKRGLTARSHIEPTISSRVRQLQQDVVQILKPLLLGHI
jgi:hypothetical protein